MSGALDLRLVTPTKVILSNHDAEQALIGCVMQDNGAFERIPNGFADVHFHEPLHGRLWLAITGKVQGNQLAEPLTLIDQFRDDKAFEEMGGIRYLADLVDRAPPAANARDYAEVILDLALRRRVQDIAGEMAKAAGGTDLTARESIEWAEGELYALAENKTGGGFVAFETSLALAVANIAAAYQRDGGLSGLATGLLDLDHQMGGLGASDLIVLAGRPGAGKTALATNIAFNVAKTYAYETKPDGTRKTINGGVVGFFSLEMSKDQLAARLLSAASQVPSDKMRRGDIQPHEFGHIRDAAELIAGLPLYIDDTGGLTLPQLCARARRLKRTVGLDLLIIDYLQLLASSARGGNTSMVDQITDITTGLKALAKELGIPVVALSQLSRAVEQRDDKRPQLADLRSSGSIEQDADVVMFVYREAYYLGRAEPKEGTDAHLIWQEQMAILRHIGEVIIGKQRHGPTGSVKLSFNEKLTLFGNLAKGGGDFAQARLPTGEKD